MAPGFFLTEQNRYLLIDADGKLTPRGQAIISHTTEGRLGAAEDLAGTLLWLVSPASAFGTGIVVRVDGGFSCLVGVKASQELILATGATDAEQRHVRR